MTELINPLPAIRSRHANALANRERGVIDSRDDDIGVLLGEVERLQTSVDDYKRAMAIISRRIDSIDARLKR